MTALASIQDQRAVFAERLAAHTAEANTLARDLDLLQYADIPLLNTDRALLRLGAVYAEEVRANVLALRDDPEGRD